MINEPRRALALTADQHQALVDLANRLEFWGKANQGEPRWKRITLRSLGLEQTNTANEIRSILKGDRT
jgi:hypothetical protein